MTTRIINPENGIADDGRTTKPYLRASLASSGGSCLLLLPSDHLFGLLRFAIAFLK
jgi:hypothetical protein